MDAARVADRDVGHLGGDVEGDVQAFRAGRLRHQADAALHRRADVEWMQRQLELPALDGHRVEDVVDDARDLLGRGLDDRRELALLAGLGARGQEPGRPDHGVQLGAQLMTDVRPQLGVDLDRARVAVDVAVASHR